VQSGLWLDLSFLSARGFRAAERRLSDAVDLVYVARSRLLFLVRCHDVDVYSQAVKAIWPALYAAGIA